MPPRYRLSPGATAAGIGDLQEIVLCRSEGRLATIGVSGSIDLFTLAALHMHTMSRGQSSLFALLCMTCAVELEAHGAGDVSRPLVCQKSRSACSTRPSRRLARIERKIKGWESGVLAI